MQLFIRLTFFAVCLLAFVLLLPNCNNDDGKPRVLIFNKSEFYVHECMPAAVEALKQICLQNNWHAEVTDDAEIFTEEKLRSFAAVVFLNTAGDVLNPTQEIEFERYIQAGGGFAGIHTALDTEHNWKWYGKLVGARFDGQLEIQEASITVTDSGHPATQHLDASWKRRDEWFNMTDLGPNIQVLLNLDENNLQGGKMGPLHPIAWYQEYDGGRSFFTAMGHTPESYNESEFLEHLGGGLKYAVGNNAPLQFKEHRKAEVANTTGFVKTSLVCNLYEPMEMEPLPDGKILFIERRGAIKLYDPAANKTTVVDEFKVYLMNEEGLLGLALDPKWEQNHWIYLYYAPEESENNAIKLSRFVFDGAKLDRGSETVLLEIPTDRSVHNYHAGGCIEFDGDGYLYLAAGDNTDHYDDGYTSIDERPGNSQYDSQKSASNSMDLRGKILRIKPLPDGSYECPAGNLFTEKTITVAPGAQLLLDNPLWDGIVNPLPTGSAGMLAKATTGGGQVAAGKGRPEIFVMGVRNPFRMKIDSRRRLLLWGEPGPDAGVPDEKRGPEGYDEINIARTAGFYGWPYFVGNNRAYRDYNYETDKSGPEFDPLHPVNNSPNNTGTTTLPPARSALIWYPFKSSTEFPLVANGTRCAMGGPAYYCDQYPAETRFPDKYDGKIIIYDWMRNWMLAIGLDSLDQLTDMQPLAESVRLARPVDMFIDKKGALWVLEYGTEWYAENPDACLSRIDYIRGDSSTEAIASTSGNTPPLVRWNFGAKNRSFYTPGDMLQYQIQVNDPEDGSLTDGRIQPSDVLVHIDYLEPGAKLVGLMQKVKPKPVPFQQGKKLVEGSDCQSCHAVERKINGPAYQDIAGKYKGDKSAPQTLTQKIIKGGSGVWGQAAMSAHPQLALKDVTEMVRWILSLGDQQGPKMQGAYPLNPPAGKKPAAAGSFVFHAAYNDRGGAKQPSRTGSETILLRPALQQAEQADSLSKSARTYVRPLNAGTTTMVELRQQSCLVFKKIDLKGIRAVSFALEASAKNQHTGGGQLELRIGSPDGRLAGTVAIPAGNNAGGLSEAILPVDRGAWPSDGSLQDIFIVVKNDSAGEKPVVGVDWIRFDL